MIVRVIIVVTVFAFSLNAALPKKVQADMYLLKAKKSLENNDYKTAMENFENILKLGVSVPNSFHYFYAKTLYENKMYRKTLDELDTFLNNGGDKSKHYVKSLELYSNAEKKAKKIEALREKENRKREAAKQKLKQLAKEFNKEKHSVYSSVTGLMWTLPLKKKYINNPYINQKTAGLNLKSAYNYCKNLTLDGYSDWRLPTVKDFSTVLPKNRISVIDWNKYNIGYSTVFWLKGDKHFRKKPYSKNSSMYMDKYYYKVDKVLEEQRGKNKKLQTICVRLADKSKNSKYFGRKYAIFNMNNHKIMFEDSFYIDGKPYIYDIKVNLKQANSYCEKLKLGGYSDWRVPTREDMLKYIPCRINRHTYFIYEKEKNTELIYKIPTVFGSGDSGKMDAGKCKIYRTRSYSKALVRCIRDVDKSKKTDNTAPTNNLLGLEDKDN